jgi:hypothetical protein
MKKRLAAFAGTVWRMVVPVFKRPGSPVWHLCWPWGILQCWRRGDSKWGVSIGLKVGLHIHAGRLEAWTTRRLKVSRRGALERHPLAWKLEQRQFDGDGRAICPTCGAGCYTPRGEGGRWWCPRIGCKQEPFERHNAESEALT